MSASNEHLYPRLRWLALAWLVIYLPTYTTSYGVMNFLFLCNLGVILTAVGLGLQNQLLVSSQAVAAPVIGAAWGLDAGFRLLTGSFLFGGTAYMWDPQYPAFARFLSLYHLVWPILVVWCVKERGYDRRGWPLQTAVAAAGLLIARLFTAPELNVNFAFVDPLFKLQLGPPPVHLAVVLAALGVIVYGLTHWLLVKVLRCPPPSTVNPTNAHPTRSLP